MKACTLMVNALMALTLVACGSSEHEGSDVQSATVGVEAAAAGAQAVVGMADFLYKVITESIDRAEKNAKLRTDRSAFLSATVEELYHRMNIEASKRKIRPYNVVICGGDLHCSLRADEGMHYAVKTFNFQDRHYTAWAFRGGKLDNPTAGGWDNWVMMGCHDHRTGEGARTVNFADTGWVGGRAEDAIPGCL